MIRHPHRARIFLLCGSIFLVVFVGTLSNIYRQGRVLEEFPANAIIVLGASQWNGTPSPVFKTRLDRAIQLYTRGLASSVVLTGGRGEGETMSESTGRKKLFVGRGR